MEDMACNMHLSILKVFEAHDERSLRHSFA